MNDELQLGASVERKWHKLYNQSHIKSQVLQSLAKSRPVASSAS